MTAGERRAFHVILHPVARIPRAGPPATIQGVDLPTLERPEPEVLARSFEQIAELLPQISRLYFEPDGSFVWAERPWQVEGQLHEAAGGVVAVELRGTADMATWSWLLHCLGWPQQQLVVQLPVAGAFVPLEAFQRHWIAPGPQASC